MEKIYAEMPRIQQLWIDLSNAYYDNVIEGESILKRLKIPVWETEDPHISKAWTVLTAPENLDELKTWGEQKMNPVARESTNKAIEACKKRI